MDCQGREHSSISTFKKILIRYKLMHLPIEFNKENPYVTMFYFLAKA